MIDTILVGERRVGVGGCTYVVAEAGSNHNQDLGRAKKLIDVSADAGADAVKFQLYEAEDLYPPEAPGFSAVKETELPEEWLGKLSDHARLRGITFLATPFSERAVDRLVELNVPAFKWASSESTNLHLLRYAASRGKPMLLSTGMCNLADIYEAVEVARSADNQEIILLQCTSVYPAPPSLIHLRAMDTLRAAFHLPVGLSDHSTETAVAVAAVARGACLVEKHITLDRTLEGPDHHYALEPSEFERLVSDIRTAEEALGDPDKRMLDEEAALARRETLKAARNIEEGAVIVEADIVSDRPATGVPPRFRSLAVGSRARRSIPKGEGISWADLSHRAAK